MSSCSTLDEVLRPGKGAGRDGASDRLADRGQKLQPKRTKLGVRPEGPSSWVISGWLRVGI